MKRVALLELQGYRFAVAVGQVGHIIETDHVYRLPLCREGFTGVVVYEDELIPCLDLFSAFDLEVSSELRDSPYTIIYCSEIGTVGLPADKVLQVVDGASGELIQGGETVFFEHKNQKFRLLEIDLLLSSIPDVPAAFQDN